MLSATQPLIQALKPFNLHVLQSIHGMISGMCPTNWSFPLQ